LTSGQVLQCGTMTHHGADAMTHYRAYIIGKDGKFVGAQDLDCESDEDAIKAAKPLVNGSDVEIWQTNRRVAQLRKEDI
jgi:hypothetical protein